MFTYIRSPLLIIKIIMFIFDCKSLLIVYSLFVMLTVVIITHICMFIYIHTCIYVCVCSLIVEKKSAVL